MTRIKERNPLSELSSLSKNLHFSPTTNSLIAQNSKPKKSGKKLTFKLNGSKDREIEDYELQVFLNPIREEEQAVNISTSANTVEEKQSIDKETV